MLFKRIFFVKIFKRNVCFKRNEHLDTDVVSHVVGAVRVVPEVVAVLMDQKNKIGKFKKQIRGDHVSVRNMYYNVQFTFNEKENSYILEDWVPVLHEGHAVLAAEDG